MHLRGLSLPFKSYLLVESADTYDGKYYTVIPEKQNKVRVVKVLMKRAQADKKYIKRILAERECMAKLNYGEGCAFIVKMLEVYQTPSRCCFVYESYSSVSLKELVQTYGVCSLEKCAIIAKQMVLALEYVHSKDKVHRDIRPKNFRLSPNGQLKLIGFENATDLKLGETLYMNLVLRTIDYSAPELIRGAHGHEVDWWGFGAVIYYLVTGKLLFAQYADRAEKKNAIRDCEKIDLSEMQEDIYGADLIDLLKSLLTEREKRLDVRKIKEHGFLSHKFVNSDYEEVVIDGTYLTDAELYQYNLELYPNDKIPVKVLEFTANNTATNLSMLDTVYE
ncbi:Calcium/calmodulin-dependent protein kinase type IV [Cichlidogyrus casuarinus]|uniref:Serine/threonine-protein kinase greatwall n=1 Tax=Cichlidogyrus casuarinus TaxID=1844966 RepID=A0ABD2QHG8_9PLAT